MRKLNSKVRTNFISEEGTYLQNKDYFAFVELDHYACYVIADGIDDDTQLESAQIVVTSFIRDFTDKPSMRKSVIRKYIKNANDELLRSSNNVRLKASMTVVISDYAKIRYAMVGNTRFLYFNDGNLRIKSRDESLTEEMAEKGMVSLDKVSEHIERNNLLSYLGENKLEAPYVSKKIKLSDGDVFVLLTRGIWENCDEREIEDALEGATDPAEVADDIEELILSKQPDRLENYTLAITFFDKVFINPNKKKTIKKVLTIAIPIVVALIAMISVIGTKIHAKNVAIEEMKENIESGDEYLKDSNPVRALEEYQEADKVVEKYNLKDTKKELDGKIKYTESINLGDKKLDEGKYQEAMDQYEIALKKSAKYDYMCKEYIVSQSEFANNCKSVDELLELGDTELENKNYASAKANYNAAKDLASKCNLSDQRNSAQDKLKEVIGLLDAEDDAKKKAEEEKEEKAQESYDKGIEYMQNGDQQYIAGNYVSASQQYNLAMEQFKTAENETLVKQMEDKLKNIDQLIESQKREAASYVTDARNLLNENKIDEAKEKYRKAQEIYKNLELMDEYNAVEKEIGQI